MQVLDYVTLLLFATGVLLSGLLLSRSGRSVRSFFNAGGSVPWPMAGLSLFMGFFSAGTFVVWGSIAYSYGWVSVTIQWGMCLAGIITGLFIAQKWNKTGVLTAAEYITSRLGVQTQKTYTILFLFVSLFTTGSFLYPVGKIIAISTGLSLTASIALIGLVSIFYVSLGGLRAVVVTDVLQFVILFAAVLIVIPLSFRQVGGVSSWLEATPEGFFDLTAGQYTPLFVIAFSLYNTAFLAGNWAYVQRYTSVKDGKSARKVGLLFAALYSFCPILWMLPPMIYRVLSPGLVDFGDEGAYLLMCKEVLPSGLLGLMLGGMVFATASSLNATLNISSAVFTNDIFKRLRPSAGEKTLMRVARLSTIGFGIAAIVVALLIPSMGGVVNVVISVGALTGVPLYLPVIWSLFSKRQTGKSVLAVTLISLFVNLFFKFVTPSLFGLSLDRTGETVLGVSLPIVLLALYELMAKFRGVVSCPQYDDYVATRKGANVRDKAPEEPDNGKDNAFSVKIIGLGISISGALICLIGALSRGSASVVCPIGGLLFVLGTFLYLKGKKLARNVI
jgi:SSS family transporter